MVPPSLSIIVPIYNESAILENHLNEISSFFQALGESFELIAVNDGSTDESDFILHSLQSSLPLLHIISSNVNHGKGYAVRQGALRAKGEWLLVTDTDLSTPLDEYHKLKPHMEYASIVFGSRGLPESILLVHQPRYKELLGKLGNRIVRAVLGIPFRDTQCGFKLFRRESTIDLFQQLTLPRWGFDFELLYLAFKKQLPIVEVPVVWRNDSTSAVKPLDYLKTFRDVFRVRWNDLRGRYGISPE